MFSVGTVPARYPAFICNVLFMVSEKTIKEYDVSVFVMAYGPVYPGKHL